jgi:hypothetical protein
MKTKGVEQNCRSALSVDLAVGERRFPFLDRFGRTSGVAQVQVYELG